MTTDRNSEEADALDVILAASKPTPPASIPAAEVQALVETWEKDIAEASPFNKKDLRPARFVRELAKLIPRKP